MHNFYLFSLLCYNGIIKYRLDDKPSYCIVYIFNCAQQSLGVHNVVKYFIIIFLAQLVLH